MARTSSRQKATINHVRQRRPGMALHRRILSVQAVSDGPAYPFLKPAMTMLTQQQTTAACTDSAVTKFDDLIDRIKLAGRQTAESWLGSVAPDADADAQESRVRAMTGCLSSTIAAPLLIAPVLLTTFAWPYAVSGALAAAALPVAAAGLLAATGSERLAGRAALAGVAVALVLLATLSGGIASPFLILLALLPLEAALRSSRLSGLVAGFIAAALAGLAIVTADLGGYASAVPAGAQAAATMASVFYALARGLAFALQAPAPVAVPAIPAVEAAPETSGSGADNVLDRLPGLLTLHDARGNVVRVAGADQAEFASKLGDVTGTGFINRIHVADRIAFLDAVDSLRRGESRSHVELRFDCPRTDLAIRPCRRGFGGRTQRGWRLCRFWRRPAISPPGRRTFPRQRGGGAGREQPMPPRPVSRCRQS
jgi:hypothetical protein